MSALLLEAMPRAFLGIGAGFKTPTARICCKCASRPAAEARAAELGMDTTHGLCPDCLAIVIAEVDQAAAKKSA